MNEVIDIITSGRSVEHTITIPEGLTSEQIVERLKENDLLVGEIAQIPAEGSLLPDTYKINRAPRARPCWPACSGNSAACCRISEPARQGYPPEKPARTGDARLDRREGNRPRG